MAKLVSEIVVVIAKRVTTKYCCGPDAPSSVWALTTFPYLAAALNMRGQKNIFVILIFITNLYER
jgi:hypothetical protein